MISRGRDIETNEWVYGYYWKEFDEKVYIGADIGAEWDCVKYRSLVEVFPKSVGRLTGFCDITGEEFYEKDTIRIDDSNWGYGGIYDATHDSYLYIVVEPIEKYLREETWYPLTALTSGQIVKNCTALEEEE